MLDLSQHCSPKPKPVAAPREKKQRKPPRARNRRRYSVKWLRQFHSPERRDFVNSLPCVVGLSCAAGKRQNHHTPSRGAGGTYLDISPICSLHHRQFHEWGQESFEALYDLKLRDTNAQTELKWSAEKQRQDYLES